MTILPSPLDATDSWLSEILGARVEIAANEPIADAGIISSVARLRLNSEAGPSSVIVKCAPSDDSFRTRLSWALKSEALFYRDIGERSGMPVPHCWYSEFREEDSRCTIVMEDLHPLVPGDNWEGLSYEKGLRGVELLAQMHGRFWGETDEWPWLAERAEAFYSTLGAAEDALPGVLERYGERFPDSVRALVPTLVEYTLSPETVARTATHVTLVHGDFHAANIAFGESLNDVKVFDWQLAMAATPGLDLVKLVFNGLTVNQRRSFGDELLDTYSDRMATGGVDIEADMLRALIHDALVGRMGALMRLSSWAEAGSFTERWAILCFERMGAALDDGW